jgi:hypothetical protein
VLAYAALGALTALGQLRGISVEQFLPTKPEEFFNLVGMAEWFALGEKYQPATLGQEA